MPALDVAKGLTSLAAITGTGIAVNAIAPGVGTAIGLGTGAFAVFARERKPHHARVNHEVQRRIEAASACHKALPRGWDVSLEELRPKGAKVDASRLPHPREVGFVKTRLASRVGQKEDWAYQLPDRSRLHAHEYDDGRVVVHRDRLDPALGVFPAIEHYVTEAPSGQVMLGALLVGVLGVTAWWGTR